MSSPPSSAKIKRKNETTPRRREKRTVDHEAPVDTPTAILSAAESLFIEMGYAGTSLRAVATRAGVNLASAHYHFGSKAGLLGAVIRLRVDPANRERSAKLDALKGDTPNPSVRQLLEVFFSPLASGGLDGTLPRLIARLYGEPESLSRPLIEREFGQVSRRFVGALGAALPDIDEEELAWRFHFMIGAMIHMIAFGVPLGREPSSDSSVDGLARLIDFATAGITNGGPLAHQEERA
jgi:AcrR family transcriptional regulator